MSVLVALPAAVILNASPADAADPLPAGFVDQIKSAGADLAGVSLLDDLAQTVPGFGTNPAILLGLHEPFNALNSLAVLSDTDRSPPPSTISTSTASSSRDAQAAVNSGVATLTFELVGRPCRDRSPRHLDR